MYGNFFPQMPQNPYMQAVQPQKQEVVKVNGENGARTYQMPPNSSALLLDESGQIVWLVVTDGAGYKSVGAYDITPHEEAPAPDYSTLEQRIARLEETINAYTANSTNARTEPSERSNGADKAHKRYDAYDTERKQSFNGNAGADKP